MMVEGEKAQLREPIEAKDEKQFFQLFFLKNDESQSVEVKEAEEIDFKEIESHLKQGASVFITRKHKLNTTLPAEERSSEHWYFTRI